MLRQESNLQQAKEQVTRNTTTEEEHNNEEWNPRTDQ